MQKPVVHYQKDSLIGVPTPGGRVRLLTLDHPRQEEFDLGEPVVTSTIELVGPAEGEFYTRNTHYVPQL